MCLVVNIFSSILVFLPFICVSGVSRILGLLTLGTIHLVSGVVNGVSAYGCMELRSIILQNSFLAIDMTVILDKYIREEQFRHNWDNLQRQYFCCGTFNYTATWTGRITTTTLFLTPVATWSLRSVEVSSYHYYHPDIQYHHHQVTYSMAVFLPPRSISTVA